jgi:hypothetical protein
MFYHHQDIKHHGLGTIEYALHYLAVRQNKLFLDLSTLIKRPATITFYHLQIVLWPVLKCDLQEKVCWIRIDSKLRKFVVFSLRIISCSDKAILFLEVRWSLCVKITKRTIAKVSRWAVYFLSYHKLFWINFGPFPLYPRQKMDIPLIGAITTDIIICKNILLN